MVIWFISNLMVYPTSLLRTYSTKKILYGVSLRCGSAWPRLSAVAVTRCLRLASSDPALDGEGGCVDHGDEADDAHEDIQSTSECCLGNSSVVEHRL